MAARRQHPRDRRADEAGRSGQQCRPIRCHAAILPSSPPTYSPARRNRCRAARPPPPPGRKVDPVKKLSIALALAGLLLGTVLIGWFGFGRVIAGVRSIGWEDFALIVGWQLVLFAVLGLAWDAIVPPREARRPWVFIWGRMVRDAVDQLPAVLPGGRLRVRRPGGHAARRVVVAGDRLHGGRCHRRVPRPARVHRHRSRHPAGARAEFGARGAAGGRARPGGGGRRGADLAAAGRRAAVRPARPAHRRTLVRRCAGPRRGAAGRTGD